MQTSAETIITNLHPLEIRTLLAFRQKDQLSVTDVLRIAALSEEHLRRAVEWLQHKGLIVVAVEHTQLHATLTETGFVLNDRKLLELRILDVLEARGSTSIPELARQIQEDPKDTNSAAANLKNAGSVEILPGGMVALREGADFNELLRQQRLIGQLAAAGTRRKDDLDAADWAIIERNSRKRGKGKGLFRIMEKVEKHFALTVTGQEVLELLLERNVTGEENSQLTPQMLKDGSWKTKSFRAYNITSVFPRIVVGKKNPYRQFLDFVKRTLISLGFEEMRGPLVESEFWDMDALYMPQFHPARSIHDAYYLKTPTHCQTIPEPAYSQVAETHIGGGASGSKGWRYQFDREQTKRLVLRSQGTALSVRQLANHPKIPGKYFAIARCFRYDAVDCTHAPDFFQIEGIVLGAEIDFRHLLGLLKLFALEVAHSAEVKFSPNYYPYTEPSIEVSMRHPQLGWMELGGAGIFRPEVTHPHGIDVPVIAWGLGLDRMAMVALNIQDIRDLFSTDLDVLRTKRVSATI